MKRKEVEWFYKLKKFIDMKKFRLPRKTKKRIYKGFWFYPKDPATNTYLVASPRRDQQDYDAWRAGILIDIRKR